MVFRKCERGAADRLFTIAKSDLGLSGIPGEADINKLETAGTILV
jgi:hypothetical protein